MSSSPSSPVPVYFELGWSILSSIGLINVCLSLLVVGITNLSPIALVPIVVSAAAAVANGLCYYAFYADYPLRQTMAAAAIADVMWLIQEAGMSFYSYQILTRVLNHRSRLVFLCIFWLIMVVIVGIRTAIVVSRAMQLLAVDADVATALQTRVNRLHIGYFTSIAVVELVSAGYLLRIFSAAKQASAIAFRKDSLFRQLMRSTEIRLATLAVVGVTRSITYSFQSSVQAATSTPSQVDRFAYTLECVFPLVMLIDIMASKVALVQISEAGYSLRTARITARNTEVNPNDLDRSRMNRDSFILLEPRAAYKSRNTAADYSSSTS